MDIIHAESVSVALSEALFKLHVAGELEPSRNGAVLVMPQPVMTTYYQPAKRVLFSPVRNANPFFHLMESLWMLKGRNDLKFPMKFNKRFAGYSDDGKTIWGAYGHRWREFFGYDQLNAIVQELRKNPASRRAVLAMWNAMEVFSSNFGDSSDSCDPDLHVAMNGGKDVPCNTHAYFDLRGGALNMTVCNRSNDALWGAYGANAVHFSILLEYMAARIGVPMGVYRQFSNNLHLYTDVVPRDDIITMAQDVQGTDLYNQPNCPDTAPLVDCDLELWHNDLHRFMMNDGLPNPYGWTSHFISNTAVPMYLAWENYKKNGAAAALLTCEEIGAWDWRLACTQWMERRVKGAAK